MSSRKKRNTCNYADENKWFQDLNDNAKFTLQQAYLAPKDLEGRENQLQSFKRYVQSILPFKLPLQQVIDLKQRHG